MRILSRIISVKETGKCIAARSQNLQNLWANKNIREGGGWGLNPSTERKHGPVIFLPRLTAASTKPDFCFLLTLNVKNTMHLGPGIWILEVWSENECGKWHFLVWNRVRIWRTGRHTPTKNSHEYPPRSYFNMRQKLVISSEPDLWLLQHTDEPQRGRNSCLWLQSRSVLSSFGVVLMSCRVNFHVVRSALQYSACRI